MPILLPGANDTTDTIQELTTKVLRLENKFSALAGFCASMAEEVEQIKMVMAMDQQAQDLYGTQEQGDIVMNQDEQPETLPEANALQLSQALSYQLVAGDVFPKETHVNESSIRFIFKTRDDEVTAQGLIEAVMQVWSTVYNCDSLEISTTSLSGAYDVSCGDSECPVCGTNPDMPIDTNPGYPKVVSLADFKASIGM